MWFSPSRSLAFATFLALAASVGCGGESVDPRPPDASVDDDAGVCEGADCLGKLGDLCDSADDCQGGYCVPGPNGDWCTRDCSEPCPDDWSCLPQGDGDDLVCVYNHTAYCMPCDSDAECANPIDPLAGNVCAPLGDGSNGSFCATVCDVDEGCPEGARCVTVDLPGGGKRDVCRPYDGVCDCNQWATSQGASTSCEVANEAGVCGGQRVCEAGGLTACSAAVPAAEMCNGIDDNCNGETDEGFVLTGPDGSVATAVGVPCGVGACAGGVTVCDESGTGIICSTAHRASAEVCDGVDNSCNGLTDGEDPALVIEACEMQSGVCSGATKPVTLCENGQWGTCGDEDYLDWSASHEPGLELSCDGLDNDCDGESDEDLELTGPDGTVTTGIGVPCGVGACAGGVTICDGHGGVICSTAHLAGAEICDGIDNSCNGLTDGEDPALVIEACEKQEGVCSGAMKPASLCVDGYWDACGDGEYLNKSTHYEPGVEASCDGLDNDCDGETDEDFSTILLTGVTMTGVGEGCGVGACGGGIIQCNAAKTGTICSSEANATAEVCDGVDNDCDGLVDGFDPSLELVACEKQDGVCSGAMKTADFCAGGHWRACDDGDYLSWSAQYEAGIEASCDGLDNDCDGDTDEDFVLSMPDGSDVVGVGTACGVGACAGGNTVCNAAQTAIECPTLAYAHPEVCDGEDNDCNGLTDALDPSLERVACEMQEGVCSGAMKPASLCLAGVWLGCEATEYSAWSSAWEETETLCDGLDNDCSGAIDDGLFAPENPNQAGACSGSQQLCGGATGWAPDYSSVPTYGETETPDEHYFDDNCDGIDGTADIAVFVSPDGENNELCGFQSEPCRTLPYALGKVTSERPHVYVQAGTYSGFVELPNDAEIYGGFDTNWQRAPLGTPGHTVTLTDGKLVDNKYMTVRALNVGTSERPVRLADLEVIGPNASGQVASRGRSSHAIHVQGSDFEADRLNVVQGNGADGANGASGSGYAVGATANAGAKGGNADQGLSPLCSTYRQPGGNGGTSSCGNGGKGGEGGSKDTSGNAVTCKRDATDGLQGLPTGGTCGAAGRGGCGGAGKKVGGAGGKGGNGTGSVTHGSGGVAGSGGGANATYRTWFANDGKSGSLGSNGSAGAGGGGSGGSDEGTNSEGAGGGGGGGAGCRASVAGAGGYGGGGSFGVFAYDSTLAVRSSVFTRGNGGKGGAGGASARGQGGGAGGKGGDPAGNSKAGGDGGSGVAGGHSGGGGGGAGGISYGIYTVTSTLTSTTDNDYGVAGAGGAGGTGGSGITSTQRGADGLAGAFGTEGS